MEVLVELIHCVECLNENLKRDLLFYKKREYEKIEQSNVDKLSLKTKLDELVNNLVQSPMILNQHADLWEQLVMQVKINSDLLAINNKVVANNLNYYDQLVRQLIKTRDAHSSTYNKLALTE